jgi:hypothetical protein
MVSPEFPKEHALAVVAALGDVMGTSDRNGSRKSGHDAILQPRSSACQHNNR